MKLGRVSSIANIPLGYEINVRGPRTADGSVVARQLDAKPNGIAAYENEVRRESDNREAEVMQIASNGTRPEGAGIVDTGPDAERVRRIVARLVPPYLDAARVRVRVIQTNTWGAWSMANGAIWVSKGLLDDTPSDDELAFALGHELAHYTHEHGRRGTRNSILVQLAWQVTQVALEHVNSPGKNAALTNGADLALSAWDNGYGRVLEDQADRVGLRYAYEAGFDVTQAPRIWRRILERYGQPDRVSNFFLGGHSRPSERIRNIERELRLNYQQPAAR